MEDSTVSPLQRHQVAPVGAGELWTRWLITGGRGSGKTHAMLSFVGQHIAERGPDARVRILVKDGRPPFLADMLFHIVPGIWKGLYHESGATVTLETIRPFNGWRLDDSTLVAVDQLDALEGDLAKAAITRLTQAKLAVATAHEEVGAAAVLASFGMVVVYRPAEVERPWPWEITPGLYDFRSL